MSGICLSCGEAHKLFCSGFGCRYCEKNDCSDEHKLMDMIDKAKVTDLATSGEYATFLENTAENYRVKIGKYGIAENVVDDYNKSLSDADVKIGHFDQFKFDEVKSKSKKLFEGPKNQAEIDGPKGQCDDEDVPGETILNPVYKVDGPLNKLSQMEIGCLQNQKAYMAKKEMRPDSSGVLVNTLYLHYDVDPKDVVISAYTHNECNGCKNGADMKLFSKFTGEIHFEVKPYRYINLRFQRTCSMMGKHCAVSGFSAKIKNLTLRVKISPDLYEKLDVESEKSGQILELAFRKQSYDLRLIDTFQKSYFNEIAHLAKEYGNIGFDLEFNSAKDNEPVITIVAAMDSKGYMYVSI